LKRAACHSLAILCTLAGLLLSSSLGRAGSITIGTLGSGSNSFPFGGPVSGFPGTRYQQVYNANLFPGSITISGITFFHLGSGFIDTGTYTLDLSTTSKAVNGLDITNFNNNDGPNNQLFFSGNLSGNPGSTLTLSGTPFIYDPTQGNLLLDFTISGTGPGATTFFSSMNGTFGTDSSRAQNFGGGTSGFGLVTEFTFGSAATVPEPTSLVSFAIIFVGSAGYVWRRKRSA
jgi:hypothetical protein